MKEWIFGVIALFTIVYISTSDNSLFETELQKDLKKINLLQYHQCIEDAIFAETMIWKDELGELGESHKEFLSLSEEGQLFLKQQSERENKLILEQEKNEDLSKEGIEGFLAAMDLDEMIKNECKEKYNFDKK